MDSIIDPLPRRLGSIDGETVEPTRAAGLGCVAAAAAGMRRVPGSVGASRGLARAHAVAMADLRSLLEELGEDPDVVLEDLLMDEETVRDLV